MSGMLTLTPGPAVDVSTSVDRLEPEDKLRCAPARRDPGGGGINVARVAHRLGAEVTAVFPAGGPTGAVLEALLGEEGLPVRVVPIEEDTRENFFVMEVSTGRQFKFILPGPALNAAAHAACLEALELGMIRPEWLVCSGGVPGGGPPDLYARAARAAKAVGTRVALDCYGPALALALDEGVDLFKPSLGELGAYLGRPLPDESAWLSACGQLVAAGKAGTVALSLGDKGALLVTGQGAWRAGAPRVAVASSVGAGDSFLGALLVALSTGLEPADALRRAVAAGAAALLGEGTSLCRPDDLERLERQIEVHALAPAA
jgi:6-phosphofructokinase 2